MAVVRGKDGPAWLADIERIWHVYDSQGQIPVSSVRQRSLKPLMVFPIHSEAAWRAHTLTVAVGSALTNSTLPPRWCSRIGDWFRVQISGFRV